MNFGLLLQKAYLMEIKLQWKSKKQVQPLCGEEEEEELSLEELQLLNLKLLQRVNNRVLYRF